jgi:hypothetical protein
MNHPIDVYLYYNKIDQSLVCINIFKETESEGFFAPKNIFMFICYHEL